MKHITATDFYNYTKCKYRVYMDKNTDPQTGDQLSHFLQLLWQNGVIHEEKAIKYFKEQKDKTFAEVLTEDVMDEEALKQAAEQTYLHMKKGVNFIYQGALLRPGQDSLFEQTPTFVGRPDILMRVKGESVFGDFAYVPVDIKTGSGLEENDWGADRPNQAYMAQMNFYAFLLEDVIQRPVREGYIFNARKQFIKYKLSPHGDALQNVLTKIKKMTSGFSEKCEPVISSGCGLCPWQSSCRTWAEKKNDLTLLFYLGEKMKYGFYEIGIYSIEELATVDLAKLLPQIESAKRKKFFYSSVGDNLIKSLITRAQLYLQEKNGDSANAYIIRKKPNFPKTKKEIHYDIEDDPLGEFVYMHGFWIIEKNKDSYYHAITATREKTEKKIAEKLWDFFAENKGVPIYHYAPHEKNICKKLMEKYNLKKDIYDSVFGPDGSAIDLYQWIVENTDWPLTSYSLKAIAKYTGFNWSADDAGGANSIAWYYDYLDGNDAMIDKILIYNKEDCMATAHLKKWFENKAL
ncbi:TM0106 family RecB-like putative nuclease [Patescibacteria group bacterium]|nr:TM0106 family RecB-like putative nuclease [Patescibacteria group bacterium]MBU1246785.1 TM0106 family RecB-like putative nuclease [Patescibacteria group bacterium]MBU1519196.1 TM0106 family RecB-like putative nuclease [Patescibacteria group bacterium]MBU1956569.1 TM0106 family RecB-like putative nuclease [Patescibacteria group bacterium]MBU2010233.1 TM0106 family RecB-like putative nuclease [Patescibacteria group bacterium]